MTFAERVDIALRSAQPGTALRALIADVGREGRVKTEIIELLENLVAERRTRADFREEHEEVILDVLDALRGWCHPAAEFLPEKSER